MSETFTWVKADDRLTGPPLVHQLNTAMQRIARLLVPSSRIYAGAGPPETHVTAIVGSLYLRTDGGAGTTLYVKESGSGNTGWIGK